MTDSDGSASVLILKIDEIVLYCPYIGISKVLAIFEGYESIITVTTIHDTNLKSSAATSDRL